MAKNILVIDDDLLVLRTVERYLKTKGYTVTAVASGTEALDKVKTATFDLIISDVRMPDMNGIETLQKIKELRSHQTQGQEAELPAVIMTGYSSDESYRQATSLGIVEYLYKPFELDEFLNVVERSIEKQPKERRTHPRIHVNFPIKLKAQEITAQVVNFSEGGFCFVTKERSPVDKGLEVIFDLFHDINPIETKAKVLWSDYSVKNDQFQHGVSFLELGENDRLAIRNILSKYQMDARLVALTEELVQFLNSVKTELDTIEKTHQNEQMEIEFLKQNKDRIFNGLNDLFHKTWEVVKVFEPEKYAAHQKYFQKSLAHLLGESEVNQRIYQKPLGYSGDYVVMNYICDYHGDERYLGKTLYEKLINNYTCNIPISDSNIARKEFLKEKILQTLERQETAKILSVGSGPARELIELLNEEKIVKPLTFICFDLEKKALDHVQREIEKINPQKKKFLDIRYINKDVLNIIKSKDLKKELQNCDLIYASGLFDYLSERMASRLIKELYQLVIHGGEMAICNMSLENGSHRAYYEFMGEWNMIHRTKEEMLQWTQSIENIEETKFEERHGSKGYWFLVIKK